MLEYNIVEGAIDGQAVLGIQTQRSKRLLECGGDLFRIQGVAGFVDALLGKDGTQSGVETDENRQVLIPRGIDHALERNDHIEFFFLNQGQGFEIEHGFILDDLLVQEFVKVMVHVGHESLHHSTGLL